MSFKGTASRSAQAIAEEIEAVGGELNAATGLESTAYFARVLKGDEGVALELLADILMNSRFASGRARARAGGHPAGDRGNSGQPGRSRLRAGTGGGLSGTGGGADNSRHGRERASLYAPWISSAFSRPDTVQAAWFWRPPALSTMTSSFATLRPYSGGSLPGMSGAKKLRAIREACAGTRSALSKAISCLRSRDRPPARMRSSLPRSSQAFLVAECRRGCSRRRGRSGVSATRSTRRRGGSRIQACSRFTPRPERR